MHAAQSSFFAVKRTVALDPIRRTSISGRFLVTPAAREKSPLIPQPLRLDNKSVFQLRFSKLHAGEQSAVSCEQRTGAVSNNQCALPLTPSTQNDFSAVERLGVARL